MKNSKKKFSLALFSVVLLFFLFSCTSQKSAYNKEDWELVFVDEFNKKGLPDSALWNYDVGGEGYGNNEAQFYTKSRLENARVENGNLVIEARKESWKKNLYTSAKLFTKGKHAWTYGRIEVRAKLPKGKGTWPAIWMMSENMKTWPDDGEIDIMEHVGFNEGFIHASIHTKKYNHLIHTQKTDTIFVKDATEKFHVYLLDWSPEKIEVYVDDEKIFTTSNSEKTYEAWPFDQPFYLILNVAIGGNWGGKEGVDEGVFPQKMLVDYVRIYQQRKQKNKPKFKKNTKK